MSSANGNRIKGNSEIFCKKLTHTLVRSPPFARCRNGNKEPPVASNRYGFVLFSRCHFHSVFHSVATIRAKLPSRHSYHLMRFSAESDKQGFPCNHRCIQSSQHAHRLPDYCRSNILQSSARSTHLAPTGGSKRGLFCRPRNRSPKYTNSVLTSQSRFQNTYSQKQALSILFLERRDSRLIQDFLRQERVSVFLRSTR